MNSGWLLLCVAALAGACTRAPELQTASVGHLPKGPLGVCDAANFVSSVEILNAGYTVNPNAYTPPYSNVQPGASLSSISSNAAADLTDAFNNAPGYFQHLLCKLDGVYISPAGAAPPGSRPKGFDGSWGFRSWAVNAPDPKKEYIAISGGLWLTPTSHAILFSEYETDILQFFSRSWSPPPSVTSANPDTPWMTVLAALAHEAGHIRWAKITHPNGYGGTFDASKLGCVLAYWSYNGNTQLLDPPGGFRRFGTRDNQVEHVSAPLLQNLHSNAALYSLYQRAQPWPNIFGSNSPDEDLIETYVLRVLTLAGPPLQSLQVNVPGFLMPVDIPAEFVSGKKGKLVTKAKCIHQLDPS
jgi:hypothetical protein